MGWIHLTLPAVLWTPMSLDTSTTILPEVSRKSSRITSPSRTSLLSWVWTSCLRKTNLRSQEPGRSRDSSLNLSRSLRSSPATPAKLVPISETISGFQEILAGKYDHLPEVAFYMVGNVDEVVAKADRLAAERGE